MPRERKAPLSTEAGDPEVEVRDVTDGLWLWRQRHWEWRPGDDWEPNVSSFVAEANGEVLLIDPLAPRPPASGVYDRLGRQTPTAAVVLKPDHVRDVDLFVHWYGIPAYGPWLFWRNDLPKVELKPVRPGDALPGGAVALYDGRDAMETPIYLPNQRAIVFADAMTAPGGVLRVWWSPGLRERTLPALRAMLELPFDHVLVAHGTPVHNRDDFEAALEREPWSAPTTT